MQSVPIHVRNIVVKTNKPKVWPLNKLWLFLLSNNNVLPENFKYRLGSLAFGICTTMTVSLGFHFWKTKASCERGFEIKQ
jgi:hypothetical protein